MTLDTLLETWQSLSVSKAQKSSLSLSLSQQQAFMHSLSAKLDQFETDRDQMQSLISQLRSKNDALESQSKSLLLQLGSETGIATEITRQLHTAQENLSSTQDQLHAEIDAKNTLILELQKQKSTQQALREQVLDMEYEVRQCVEKLGSLSALKERLSEQESLIEDLQSQNQDLRRQLEQGSNRARERRASLVKQSQQDFQDPVKETLMDPLDDDERRPRSPIRRSFTRSHPISLQKDKQSFSPSKVPVPRMTVDATGDHLFAWYQMESVPPEFSNSEPPTFLFEEAEKAKLTVQEFTEYIQSLELGRI